MRLFNAIVLDLLKGRQTGAGLARANLQAGVTQKGEGRSSTGAIHDGTSSSTAAVRADSLLTSPSILSARLTFAANSLNRGG